MVAVIAVITVCLLVLSLNKNLLSTYHVSGMGD